MSNEHTKYLLSVVWNTIVFQRAWDPNVFLSGVSCIRVSNRYNPFQRIPGLNISLALFYVLNTSNSILLFLQYVQRNTIMTCISLCMKMLFFGRTINAAMASKPVLKGLLASTAKRQFAITCGACLLASAAWRFGVQMPRRKRYEEFFKLVLSQWK